ncbi:MAG: LysR family transcriptional regulator [Rhodospirillaceae bacterium]|nr:LysR family transcriptional regulator [Rhodospirillaceae bacterium]|tara:strand:+ start:1473 stop:2384 length:912 start_codon:yes stop_codon:yes gene_type:complete
MITLRQLRFLVALVDELNFSRAAAACHVTQPTLSTGLKELEEMLGVRLAERNRRSVIITSAGREIALRARALLLAAREIEDLAAQHSNPNAGDLRLGAIPTIGPFLIPKVLSGVRGAFPNLRLFLREEVTESLLDGLAAGRLDAALIAQPFDVGSLETEFLFDDGYHLAAPRGHPGEERKAVTGTELDGARLMLLEKGHCLQRHALSAFPDRNIQQDESFAATSLSTLISMVGEGLGITLLPDLAIDAGAAAGYEIDLVPLVGARPRHVVMAWRPTSPRRDLFLGLSAIFRETRTAMRSAALG